MSGIISSMLASTKSSIIEQLKSIEKHPSLGKYGTPVAQATALAVGAVAATALVGVATYFMEMVATAVLIGAVIVVASPFAEADFMKKIKTTALSILDQTLDRVGLNNVFEDLGWVSKADTDEVEASFQSVADMSTNQMIAQLTSRGYTVKKS